MDDQNTFERQLAIGLDRLAGPPRPVDAMAVARSVTSQSGKWGFTMLSAVKFIAAAAIVALFGGFLLAGVLTTPQEDEVLPAAVTDSPEPETTTAPTEPTLPPDPSVRTDILPGVALNVEEVEPGVLWVRNDGVSDFAYPVDWEIPYDIVAGHDGGIYVLEPGHYARLGEGGGSAEGHKGFDWTHRGRFPVRRRGRPRRHDLGGVRPAPLLDPLGQRR